MVRRYINHKNIKHFLFCFIRYIWPSTWVSLASSWSAFSVACLRTTIFNFKPFHKFKWFINKINYGNIFKGLLFAFLPLAALYRNNETRRERRFKKSHLDYSILSPVTYLQWLFVLGVYCTKSDHLHSDLQI